MFTQGSCCFYFTGVYQYTEDLWELDRVGRLAPRAMVALSKIVTPLRYCAWESMLVDHPDRRFQEYLLQGIAGGFRIGYSRSVPLSSARANMVSATEHPEVVSVYLQKEVDRGVLLGPFDRKTVPHAVISRLHTTLPFAINRLS